MKIGVAKEWNDINCSNVYHYICQLKVGRGTKALSVAVNLLTIDHINTKTYFSCFYSLDFPLNDVIRVCLASQSATAKPNKEKMAAHKPLSISQTNVSAMFDDHKILLV